MLEVNDYVKEYQNKGFLVIDELFSKDEVKRLTDGLETFESLKELPNIIQENNGEIRSIFAPQEHSEAYNWLYRQERILSILEAISGEKQYLYQFKLNNKRAFVGEAWEWHQDFPYWHLDDGVKEPKMFSVMILLQDTESYQGPLILIPQSHKNGVVEFEFKEHLLDVENDTELSLASSLGADLKYTVKRSLIKKLINEFGTFEFKGKAGSAVIFHPNLFHASGVNLSPYDRNTAIVTYNSVSNPPHPGENKRPSYLCNYDSSPIEKIGKLSTVN